jgi:restriction system protein
VAVPDFQTIMRPALLALDGDRPVPVQEIRSSVATALDVSDDDLSEMLGSGRVTRFANRVGWALTHMSKAVLVERPSRAYYSITDRGRDVLAANPHKVGMNVLLAFSEYQEFRSPKAVADAEVVTAYEATVSAATELSHEEALSNIIEIAHADLSHDILTAILAQPPVFLERLALRLLAAMGYGGREALTEHTGKPGDAGLDGLIRQDALGLELVGVQAKRYDRDSSVGRPEIRRSSEHSKGPRRAAASSSLRGSLAPEPGNSPRTCRCDWSSLTAPSCHVP